MKAELTEQELSDLSKLNRLFMSPQWTCEDFVTYEDEHHEGQTCPLRYYEAQDGDTDLEVIKGKYWWRMSAPGYMDCTEWSGPFESEGEALRDCLEDNWQFLEEEDEEDDRRES